MRRMRSGLSSLPPLSITWERVHVSTGAHRGEGRQVPLQLQSQAVVSLVPRVLGSPAANLSITSQPGDLVFVALVLVQIRSNQS